MKKISVLVVDDEPNIRLALQTVLENENFQVFLAADGSQALEMYQVHKPDIVLMDVMMPRQNGFETAGIIRSKDQSDTCKIVFLTARGTQHDKLKGYKSGGEYYLVKPFDNQELVSLLQEI